jgi:hypothetical protein
LRRRRHLQPAASGSGGNGDSASTSDSELRAISPSEKRLAQALRAQSFRLESALETLLARQQQQAGGGGGGGSSSSGSAATVERPAAATSAAPAGPAPPQPATLVGIDGDIWQVVEELRRVAQALEEAGVGADGTKAAAKAAEAKAAASAAATKAAEAAAAVATQHAASWAVATSPAPVRDALQAAYPPAPRKGVSGNARLSAASSCRLPLPPQHPRPPPGAAAAPARRIAVCTGSKCRRAGSDALLAAASSAAAAAASSAGAGFGMPAAAGPGASAAAEVGACRCLGKCKRAAAVRVEEPDGTTVVLTNVGTDEVQRLVFASAPLFF